MHSSSHCRSMHNFPKSRWLTIFLKVANVLGLKLTSYCNINMYKTCLSLFTISYAVQKFHFEEYQYLFLLDVLILIRFYSKLSINANVWKLKKVLNLSLITLWLDSVLCISKYDNSVFHGWWIFLKITFFWFAAFWRCR